MAEELFDGTMVADGLAFDWPDVDVAETVEQGVVIANYPTDHPKNRFKQGMEYDVLFASRVVTRCRSALSRTGYENGMDIPLNASSKTTDGSKFEKSSTRLEKMAGDHVLVTFPYDDALLPVITDRLPHPASQMYEANNNDEASLNRPLFAHEKVEIEVSNDGQLTVRVLGSEAKRVRIISEGAEVKIEKDHIRLESESLVRSVDIGSNGVVLQAGSTPTEVRVEDDYVQVDPGSGVSALFKNDQILLQTDGGGQFVKMDATKVQVNSGEVYATFEGTQADISKNGGSPLTNYLLAEDFAAMVPVLSSLVIGANLLGTPVGSSGRTYADVLSGISSRALNSGEAYKTKVLTAE